MKSVSTVQGHVSRFEETKAVVVKLKEIRVACNTLWCCTDHVVQWESPVLDTLVPVPVCSIHLWDYDS